MTYPEPSDHHPFSDGLDDLLRDWHDENRAAAEAGRSRLLRALEEEAAARSPRPLVFASPGPRERTRVFRPAALRAAAAFVLMIVGAALITTWPARSVQAREIMVADGGRLDALDGDGVLIGPCPLRHTNVDVEVSGLIARVNVRQRFHNPYDEPIEAVYTFPLGHRGAVDRMTMTIGDRVVLGTVRERAKARAEYEAARSAGYVAGLLEQERTNIFTQSVANIAPGATIDIEIGYVETVSVRDGTYHFDFPMTVAPRYVPGAPLSSGANVPAELEARHGVVLRGPARIALGPSGPAAQTLGALAPDALRALLRAATPIEEPGTTWWGTDRTQMPEGWTEFAAIHLDGTVERGALFADGTGYLAGRWFYVDPVRARAAGGGFAVGTDEVPDAARVTPMPNRPGERAGHDVSVRVRIDSGGPAITGHRSVAHAIAATNPAPTMLALELKERNAIPNRDFRLEWTLEDETIEDSVFAHRRAPENAGAGAFGPALARAAANDPWGRIGHGFFTLALQPPARLAQPDFKLSGMQLRRLPPAPREIIFVLDSSGSMEGFPIETAKSVLSAALDTMLEDDTFNVFSFNTDWQSLWPEPRSADRAARDEAQAWVAARTGGGGTELRPAIEAALAPIGGIDVLDPAALADLPADGRAVTLAVNRADLRGIGGGSTLQVGLPGGVNLDVRDAQGLALNVPGSPTRVEIAGTWRTENGRRILVAQNIRALPERAPDPRTRYVFLLSDGELANEDAVIDSVRKRIGAARLFPVGIGSSPNRALLDGMAVAGRGVSDYVAESDDAGAAVARFVKRIDRPVLTNITLEFAGGFDIIETIPPLDAIPDLLDTTPLIVHGRYTKPGRGTVTVRGQSGHGPFVRTIDLDLPAEAPAHDAIASLWARAKVDLARNANDISTIVALGERFHLLTEHTSFVAVEAAQIRVEGAPRLVRIPIELPEGQSYPGTFGESNIDRESLATTGLSFGVEGVMVNEPSGDHLGLAPQPTQFGAWFRVQDQSGAPPVRYEEFGRQSLPDPSVYYAQTSGASRFAGTMAIDVDAFFGQPADQDAGDTAAGLVAVKPRGYFDPAKVDFTPSTATGTAGVAPGTATIKSAINTVTRSVDQGLAADKRGQFTWSAAKGGQADEKHAATPDWPDANALPLGEAVNRSGRLRQIELKLDRDALVAAGVPLETQVQLSDDQPTLFLLEDLAKQLTPIADVPTSLGWKKDGEALVLTVVDPSAPETHTLRYDLTPLLPPAAPAADPAFRARKRLAESFQAFARETSPAAESSVVDDGVRLSAPTSVHRGLYRYLSEIQRAQKAGYLPDNWWETPLDEQRAQVAEAVAQLEREREAAEAEARRATRLRRVIDQRLWALVPRTDGPEPAGETAVTASSVVTVSVLLTDVQPETIAQLRAAGLDIVATVPRIPMVVGSLAPKDLEALGLVEAVRRVEPTEPVGQD